MRKYYDEDDEYGQEQQKEKVQRGLLPAVRPKVWDWLLALALGVCAFAGLWWFSFPDLSPDVWDGAAVAAGIRPPAEVSPGLWRGLAHGFYLGGVSGGNQALMWAGRLCGALTAGCAYLLLRSLLALLVRGRLRYAVRRTVVQVVAAALGAVFFTCADPVWKAVQTFSPAGLETLLSLFAMLLWTGFLLHGGLFSAYASVFLLGFLAADTPMGFVLLAVALGIYFQGVRRGALCENMPLLHPIVGQSAKWYLTFFWAVGLIAGIAANCATYMKLGGLDAAGQVVGDLPLAYLLCWWHQLVGAADGLGWVLGVVVCVLPFAVAAVMLPRAVDEESAVAKFIPEAIEKLAQFSKEEVIAKFISAEFESVNKYYQSANDLNVAVEEPRKKGERQLGDENMSRLFINVGKIDAVRPGDIIALINEFTRDLPKVNIGHIDIMRNFSFVDVDGQYSDQIVAALNGRVVDGYRIICEVAVPRSDSDDSEGGDSRRSRGGFGGGFGGRRGGRRSDRRDGRDFRDDYYPSPRPNRADRRHRDRGGKQK